MRILFDQGVPVPLRAYLPTHSIETTYEKGWSSLDDGELLNRSQDALFDLFLTTDQNLQFEQNLSNRAIAVVILSTTSWPRIRLAIDAVKVAIDTAPGGQFTLVNIPRR